MYANIFINVSGILGKSQQKLGQRKEKKETLNSIPVEMMPQINCKSTMEPPGKHWVFAS